MKKISQTDTITLISYTIILIMLIFYSDRVAAKICLTILCVMFLLYNFIIGIYLDKKNGCLVMKSLFSRKKIKLTDIILIKYVRFPSIKVQNQIAFCTNDEEFFMSNVSNKNLEELYKLIDKNPNMNLRVTKDIKMSLPFQNSNLNN